MKPSNSGYTSPEDPRLALQVDELDEDAREFFEERSSILEYDGGHTRSKAESLAWEETKRYLRRRGGF
jgi:hypothetical protein